APSAGPAAEAAGPSADRLAGPGVERRLAPGWRLAARTELPAALAGRAATAPLAACRPAGPTAATAGQSPAAAWPGRRPGSAAGTASRSSVRRHLAARASRGPAAG